MKPWKNMQHDTGMHLIKSYIQYYPNSPYNIMYHHRFNSATIILEKVFWETFLYASSLIRSRSHEGRIEGGPEIIPLVDLFNGYPLRCKNMLNVNMINFEVELTKGINPKVAKMSILESCKDIQAGEELILDYNDITATGCLVRYAFCPKEILQSPSSSLDALILPVPKFLAPPDNLRAKACQKHNFPHTPELVEKQLVFFELGYDSLSTYNSSPPTHKVRLENLRQYVNT